MEAVFSFKNIKMDFNDRLVDGINAAGGKGTSVFNIDREVMQKQNANMALYAKK